MQLLAQRLKAATSYLSDKDELHDIPFVYLGVSTGAAAALCAAANGEKAIKAVVSCGGRPDLAAESLPLVQAATLLIVGGENKRLIELNNRALARLSSFKDLKIIPGVAHSYPEAALKEIGRLTTRCFQAHLCKNPGRVENTSQ